MRDEQEVDPQHPEQHELARAARRTEPQPAPPGRTDRIDRTVGALATAEHVRRRRSAIVTTFPAAASPITSVTLGRSTASNSERAGEVDGTRRRRGQCDQAHRRGAPLGSASQTNATAPVAAKATVVTSAPIPTVSGTSRTASTIPTTTPAASTATECRTTTATVRRETAACRATSRMIQNCRPAAPTSDAIDASTTRMATSPCACRSEESGDGDAGQRAQPAGHGGAGGRVHQRAAEPSPLIARRRRRRRARCGR